MHVRVNDHRCPGVVILVVECLNRSKEPNTKFCRRVAENPNLATLVADRNLRRRSVEFVPIDELEEDHSPEDRLKDETPPSARVPPM